MKRKLLKMVSVLLTVAMLFSFASIVSFAEEENGKAQFSVSTAFSAENGTAKIMVDVGENSKIAAALFRVTFDTAMLRADSLNLGVILKNGTTDYNITSPGCVMVAYAHITPIYDEGRLFEVEFSTIGNLSDNVSYEDVNVNLEILDLKNYDDYDIPYSVNQGKITVINTPYGDVNNNDGVTATDSLMALYAASKLIDLTDTQKICADVNGDNKVTPLDALLILQFSAGTISNFPIFNLAIPENFLVQEKDETYVTLQWNSLNSVIGYNLYMNEEKVNEDVITSNSFTIAGLLQDTKYKFSLKSVNTLKESETATELMVSTNKADRTVIFKDYDGTILSSQIVLSGLDATEPEKPVRKGYTFTGWDKSIIGITEDCVITAQYEINDYNVTINYNDGSEAIVNTYEFNTKVPKPANKNRTDYTLEGWYQDRTFTKKWNFDTDTVQETMTLYAKWVTWSEWSTSIPNGITDENYVIESRTEYSYSDKSTKTSDSSYLPGWTKYDEKITGWRSWSGWQNGYIANTASRQVETQWIAPTYKTVYCYYHYLSASYHLSSYAQYDSSYVYSSCELDSPLPRFSQYDQNGHTCWGSYPYTNMWWDQTTKQVQTGGGYTQYRYRDAIYTYYHYKWSDWSEWSTGSVTENDNRKVQTRTVYRYLLRGEE